MANSASTNGTKFPNPDSVSWQFSVLGWCFVHFKIHVFPVLLSLLGVRTILRITATKHFGPVWLRHFGLTCCQGTQCCSNSADVSVSRREGAIRSSGQPVGYTELTSFPSLFKSWELEIVDQAYKAQRRPRETSLQQATLSSRSIGVWQSSSCMAKAPMKFFVSHLFIASDRNWPPCWLGEAQEHSILCADTLLYLVGLLPSWCSLERSDTK